MAMTPKTSSRRTAGKRGPRVLLLALALRLCSVVPPCLAMSWTWTCNLDSVPVQDVPLAALHKFQKLQNARRHLRSPWPEGRGGAPSREGVDGGASGDTIAHARGRRCACADWIDGKERYYCPLPADRCHVTRTQRGRGRGRGEGTVECYVQPGWELGLARDVWIYLCAMLLILALFLCLARPGRHAARYLLSRCVPGMNDWIVEHLLRAEIEGRNLVGEEFAMHFRSDRRTEGRISEYRVRTKLHVRDGAAADDAGENATDSGDGTELDGEDCETADGKGTEENDPTLTADRDIDLGVEDCEAAEGGRMEEENANDQEDEDGICTICLMAVEDGDRIPDLDCGHLFHADCLSEWILKKNSCPLCAGPVAREIRCVESDAPEGGADNACSQDALSRLRRRVREGLLDVATGRDRRAHFARRNRIRTILNMR